MIDTSKIKVRAFLDVFSRNLCWFIGTNAYKLINPKDEKKIKEENKDQVDQPVNVAEELQNMVLSSNLLSGGIE